MTSPRLYLAGPEVFLPDAIAVGTAKAALCAQAGFEGVFPADQSLDLKGLAKREIARRIYSADEAMMRACDGAIANLTPFRGVSMDSGTAFEAGFMRALGKPVFGYTNTTLDYRARAALYRTLPPLPFEGDRPDLSIEDLDLAENLMIEVAVIASGAEVARHDAAQPGRIANLTGFKSALAMARRHFFQASA